MAQHLRENLPSLSTLSYANMKLGLEANYVITYQERQEIDTLIGDNKMAKVIEILLVSLNLKLTVKFKGFLKAMEKSGDNLLVATAKDLGKYAYDLLVRTYIATQYNSLLSQ